MTHTKPQEGAITLLGELPASPSAVRGRMSATSVLPITSRPTMGQWQECGASDWVIRAVTRGYRPQFASSPPCFNGIVLSQTHGEKALVLKEEITTLQSKGTIWVVLPEQSRFLFKVFSVPEGVGNVLGCRNYHGNDSSEEICDDGCLQKDNSKWHMKSRDAVYTHKLPGTPGGLASAIWALRWGGSEDTLL